jgi:hypothetical protein
MATLNSVKRSVTRTIAEVDAAVDDGDERHLANACVSIDRTVALIARIQPSANDSQLQQLLLDQFVRLRSLVEALARPARMVLP